MLSVKRLCQIIFIILIIGTAFLLFNISNHSSKPVYVTNDFDERLFLAAAGAPNEITRDQYYLITNEKDQLGKIIKQNAAQVLSHMKITYYEKEYVSEKELSLNPVLIFCSTRSSECIDLNLLGTFIRDGGRVLFAAGIPEGYEDSYLYPIWGIVEKGSRIGANEFRVMNEFLPYPETMVGYSSYNASTVLKLNNTVKIFIQDLQNNPIVYSNNYYKGKVVVINGTLLEDKNSGGILCGALGELKEKLLYPIIGTKTIFLDEFPPTSILDDKKSAELYGMGGEFFLRDVIWPELLRNSETYELKYTAGVLEPNNEETDIVFHNERLIKYLIKEILRYSGELILEGDYSNNTQVDEENLKKFHDEFKSIFPKYDIKGYSVLYGKADEDEIKSIHDVMDELITLRGVFKGDQSSQMVQDFEYKNGFVNFPVITSGFVEDSGEFYNFLSALGLYGVVSHSFNIKSLIMSESRETNWYDIEDDFIQLNKDYFGETVWLQPSTLSEASKNTLSYNQLQVAIHYDKDKIHIYCNNFQRGQAFYLRTDQEVEKIVGGRTIKINDRFYYIQAYEPEFAIIFQS